MKLTAVVFLLTGLLYSTLIPWDLTLVLLITRTSLVSDKSGYFLAFWFGLLNSYLLNQPLGLLSFSYILIVFLITQIKRSTLSLNWLNVLLLSLVLTILHQILKIVTNHASIDFKEVLAQNLIVLPLYFLVLVWAERFVVKRAFRLKL